MNEESLKHRLCSLSTLWSVVLQAHGEEPEAARAAQQELLNRYGGAIRRYLTAALRDPEAAAELFQEFVLHFLHGNFRNARPERGRFRDYLKTSLFHAILKHKKRRQFRPLDLEVGEPSVEPAVEAEMDREFLANWQKELLDRAWMAVDRAEAAGGRPHGTVLRLRIEHPNASSTDLAEVFTTRFGKSINAAAARQMLHRARERFAEALLEEVAQSLSDPSNEALEQELIELGLFEHCRVAFERRESGNA